MAREKKNNTAGFRLTDEQWKAIEADATPNGQTVHDWCREAALEKLKSVTSKEPLLSPNERILLEELSRVRFLVGHGFKLLASDKLTDEEWENMRKTADQKTADIVRTVLSKYVAAGHSS